MRALVVEDHPILFEGFQSILRRLDPDIELTAATTAERALEYCEADDDFDLCVVDLMLPGIDGAAFLEALVARNIWIPTVIISADDNIDKIRQALSLGALGYIPKSASPEQMLAAVERVLNGDMSIPESVRDMLDLARRAARLDVPSEVSRLGITPRQYRVLQLIADGLTNAQIACTLNVSEHTVKSHARALFQALNAPNRTACAQLAVQGGLVSPPRVARDVS